MIKDYPEYLKQQVVRAESKWARKWSFNEIFKQQLRLTIDSVKDDIKPTSICCMGVRDGTEVFEFKEYYPDAEVYGVDITHNIETIRTHLDVHIELRDFNNLPENWENKFDLIFSNSIDHAYDPAVTIQEWQRVTQNGGHILIEFSTTPPNNIEHTFTKASIKKLAKGMKIIDLWETKDRNIITGLFEVKK